MAVLKRTEIYVVRVGSRALVALKVLTTATSFIRVATRPSFIIGGVSRRTGEREVVKPISGLAVNAIRGLVRVRTRVRRVW